MGARLMLERPCDEPKPLPLLALHRHTHAREVSCAAVSIPTDLYTPTAGAPIDSQQRSVVKRFDEQGQRTEPLNAGQRPDSRGVCM
jgi:hypothetical protein